MSRNLVDMSYFLAVVDSVSKLKFWDWPIPTIYYRE